MPNTTHFHRRDISDNMVLEAYAECRKSDRPFQPPSGNSIAISVWWLEVRLMESHMAKTYKWPEEIIMEKTGCPAKVAYAAMERAYNRGYIEYGVSLRGGWLTEKGERALKGEVV